MAKTDVANRLIWFKDQIMNVNEAKVNVLSPSTQFGLNVFEGIPCIGTTSGSNSMLFA